MVDVIHALCQKRINLKRHIDEITKEHNRQLAEINEALLAVENAMSAVNEAVQDILCPNCDGKGTIRVCDAAGDMDDAACPVCHGTGITINYPN